MAEVGEEGNIFLLAFADDEPAGYAKLRDGINHSELAGRAAIEIARIYAAASFIGKGVASALIQKCIDAAQEMGKEVIWLGVWEKIKVP